MKTCKRSHSRPDEQTRCLECRHAAIRAWHASHPERVRELAKRSRAKPAVRARLTAKQRVRRAAEKASRTPVKPLVAKLCHRGHLFATGTECKDCARLRRRCAYMNDPQRFRDAAKEFADRHRPRIRIAKRAVTKRWVANNPERASEVWTSQKRKRRAAKFGGGGSHTRAEWLAVVARQQGLCAGCGEEKRLERDHIVPLSRGGSDDIGNIQGLCRSCNARKSNRIAEVVEQYG